MSYWGLEVLFNNIWEVHVVVRLKNFRYGLPFASDFDMCFSLALRTLYMYMLAQRNWFGF